jgi:hypothetical protein
VDIVEGDTESVREGPAGDRPVVASCTERRRDENTVTDDSLERLNIVAVTDPDREDRTENR